MDSKKLRGLMEAYTEVYAPKEDIDEAEKWIQKAIKKPGALHKQLGVPEDEKIPAGKLAAAAKKGGKLGRRARLAQTLGGLNKEEVEIDEATAMAKRGHDETAIRQKIAKSTGGGEAADRASALEKKSTFGDAKKAKQRQDLARKQRGDFRKTTSSSPGLHGYAHKSDDPKVKAKQAARGAQRGALTPNEKKQLNMGDESFDLFDTILEFLYVEGFAETLEEAEWMMANIIDEEAIDMISTSKEKFGSWFDEAMSNYEKNRRRAAQRAAARNAARDAGKTGAVPGVGYVTTRREKETWTDERGKTRHAKGL